MGCAGRGGEAAASLTDRCSRHYPSLYKSQVVFLKVIPVSDALVDFQRAVAEAIRDTHARGLPVFQARDGWIYAIYPDGRRVAVERAKPPMNLSPPDNGPDDAANAAGARRA